MYKYRYKIIVGAIVVEYIIVSLMSKHNIKIQSGWGNGVAALIFSIPFEILFFVISKDDRVSKIWRVLFKCIFWFWILCYLGGFVVEMVGIRNI